jgi:hypothetical protein
MKVALNTITIIPTLPDDACCFCLWWFGWYYHDFLPDTIVVPPRMNRPIALCFPGQHLISKSMAMRTVIISITSVNVIIIWIPKNQAEMKIVRLYSCIIGEGKNTLSWDAMHCLNSVTLESRSWRGVLDTTICDQVCQWFATGRWYSPGTPVSSTNKTDRRDITEILLKVVLNTINQPGIAIMKKKDWSSDGQQFP